jgi:hypothetical protein
MVHKRRMRLRATISFIFLSAVTACTQFPELDDTRTAEIQNAPYPALVPIEPIISSVDTEVINTDAAAANAEARLRRLRTEATRLRQGVLTPEEEERLRQGLR